MAAGLQHYETKTRIRSAAEAVAAAGDYSFTAGSRASRGFTPA